MLKGYDPRGLAVIPLVSWKRTVGFALIDAPDAARVSAYRWNLCGGYAVSGQVGPMHRFVLGLERGDGHCHHINELKCDNRKANIRHCEDAMDARSQPHPRADSGLIHQWHADELLATFGELLGLIDDWRLGRVRIGQRGAA